MENEIVKLLNVLRRIARAAGYAAWIRTEPETLRFCVRQYNKVLLRLTELEPAIQPLFTPLAEDASAAVTRMAASELAAYFEDEEPQRHSWSYAGRCGPRAFRMRGYPFAIHCD